MIYMMSLGSLSRRTQSIVPAIVAASSVMRSGTNTSIRLTLRIGPPGNLTRFRHNTAIERARNIKTNDAAIAEIHHVVEK